MKLASLKHGRDGRLVVVSRDLTRCADAFTVAPTLQAALDDWGNAKSRLAELAYLLEAERVPHSPFDPKACAAPLPRWTDLRRADGRRPGAHRDERRAGPFDLRCDRSGGGKLDALSPAGLVQTRGRAAGARHGYETPDPAARPPL